MSQVSIGFMRGEDEFVILATLNSTYSGLNNMEFSKIVDTTVKNLADSIKENIIVLDRQDCEHSVCIDQEYWG